MNQCIKGEHRRKRVGFRCALAAGALLAIPAARLWADPPLPTFGPAVYNITVANPAIDSGLTAATSSSDNSAVINAYIKYCSTNGGGTVEIPSGTFLSGQVNMLSNVDLQLDSGSILRDDNFNNGLIRNSGDLTNIAITGSGTIDGAATTTVGASNLVQLTHIVNLEISGVTIANAGHEHLVPEDDTNLTINNVNINDAGTLAANSGKYLANTDGIDYSGSNILIENCSVQDGDDDIVAKSANICSNITIANCTIGAGHGISVGGGTAGGLSNMVVNNCTFTGTTNGLRIKAEDAAGGDAGGGLANPLTNVTYENITMKNVTNPIIIESFYNGDDIFPNSPTNTTYFPLLPAAQDTTTPDYENIAFDNITVTGAANAGIIFGLNTQPASLSGVSFNNVNITASTHMELWYAADVDYSGLTVNVPSNDAFANASPVKGVSMFAVTVPEPTSLAIAAIGLAGLLKRRRR